MKIAITLVGAGKTHCDECCFLEHHSTGLIGEWHKTCVVFNKHGPWRKKNMKRPKKCLDAERSVK